MNKKLNLILAGVLLGGIATVLPFMFKLFLFVAAGLLLFWGYDEYDYQTRNEVGSNE